MTGSPALAGRIFRTFANRSAIALIGAERRLRYCLAMAGIPLPKPRLVLSGNRDPGGAGLFSEVRVALGALSHYEAWRHIYAGLRIDYATTGLYHEPERGPNWWNYYFEPIDLDDGPPVRSTVVSPRAYRLFAAEGERLSRARAAELVRRHVRPRADIARAVDTYASAHFAGSHVVGIHYRGTNKHEEAPRVDYGAVRAAALEALAASGATPGRIYLATDEQGFLEYMRTRHSTSLLYRDMFRSSDGRPIDEVNVDTPYARGRDAVIDCLVLSRCNFLVRTESNLGACATYFNPALAHRTLNAPHP